MLTPLKICSKPLKHLQYLGPNGDPFIWDYYVENSLREKLVRKLDEPIRTTIFKDEVLHALGIPDARLNGKVEERWKAFEFLGHDALHHKSMRYALPGRKDLYKRSQNNPLELLWDCSWYYIECPWAGNSSNLVYPALKTCPPRYVEVIRQALLTGQISEEDIVKTFREWQLTVGMPELSIRLAAFMFILEPLPNSFVLPVLRQVASYKNNGYWHATAVAKECLKNRNEAIEET